MDGTSPENGVDAAVGRPWPKLIAAVAAIAILAAVAGVALARTGGGDPPVISLGGGAVTDDAMAATAETTADLAYRSEIGLWQPVHYEFELRDGARIDAGEAPAWQLVQPDDLEAAATALAQRFDLGPVAPTEYDPNSFTAGAHDGTGPTLWIGASGDWSYGDPAGRIMWACPEPGLVDPAAPDTAAPDDVVTDDGAEPEDRELADDAVERDPEDEDGAAASPPVDPRELCEPATPPDGVPSADEARALTLELFRDLEVPGELTIMDAHADEWGAWVQGNIELDGLTTDLWVSAGWGGDATLTSANGTLADPTRADEYPTIDAEQAVARMEDGWFGGIGWGGGMMQATPAPMPMVDAPAFDVGVTTEGPAESGRAADGAEPEPMPTEPEPLPDDVAEPMPTEPEPLPDPGAEPEVVTITLTDVDPVLLLQIDADGVAWLLPGYRFTDTDGGTWQVLAVDDAYLDVPDEPEPEPVPDPAPEPDRDPDEPQQGGDGGTAPGSDGGQVEPSEPGDGGGVDGAPGHDPDELDPRIEEEIAAAQPLAEEVVGLSEDEAVRLVEEAGLVARVIARDGERFEITMDLSYGRINLEIDDGVVTAASIG